MIRSPAYALIAILFCGATSLHSQAVPAAAIAGTWVGGFESGGEFGFYTATIAGGNTLTGTGSVPMRGLSGPLRSIRVDGGRVRIEGPASVVLSGTLDGETITGDFEAQGGKAKGPFRLMRIVAVDPTTLTRYQGAYRFSDGRMLLVDRAQFDTATMPSALNVTDATSGVVRVVFALPDSTFAAGPSLLVPYPTDYTLTFRVSGNRVLGLIRTPRSGAKEEAVRVQANEEEVRFQSGDLTLRGTLLVPATPGRHPAIVFTHGGGPAVRDWFWGLGYLLAARGFAVLAFDKRGAGQSSGDWVNASFEDLADDAVAGAKFLQARTDIDSKRIGFWGLSQGAWIAPLAAVRFGAAAFVMTLSGGGLTPEHGELLDSQWELRKAGFTEAAIREAVAFQTAKNQFMRTGSGWEDYAARRARATQPRAPWFAHPGTDLGGPPSADSAEWGRARRFYFYDPAPTLRALRAPLLGIFGELDTPDGVAANVNAMTTALTEGGHRDFSIKVFPNGRHNLLDMSGAAPNEFTRLQRFVPGLFELMTSWLVERTAR
jgi:pimeloyl-ACP methyl ester carboxylesterase